MLDFEYAFFGYSECGKFTHNCKRPNIYYDIHNIPVKNVVPFANEQVRYFLDLDKPITFTDRFFKMFGAR